MRKCLVFLSILSFACCSCPAGLELVCDGQCRGFYTSLDTYRDTGAADAIKKCKEIAAQPIIIHNQEQQSYWIDHVRPNFIGDDGWTVLGLVCNAATHAWEWADGSAVDYKPAVDCYAHYTVLDQICSTSNAWAIRGDGCWSYWFSGEQDKWTTDVFCTSQLEQTVSSPDECDGFEDDGDDGLCYQIGTTVKNWQEAQKTCLDFGANLASIHNQQENSFVRRMAVSRGALDGLYLGATSSGKGSDFGWIDGTAWDYQNFYTGFPVSGRGNCVAMDTSSDTSGQWTNNDCESSFSVACVRKPGNHVCSNGPWTAEQVITSPGFPFESSISCQYLLSVEAGKRVELEVMMLEANSCCDHAVLYEDVIGGTVIANLTGEISNKVYKTKSSNYMRVSWKPNGGVNVKGMMFTFRAVK